MKYLIALIIVGLGFSLLEWLFAAKKPLGRTRQEVQTDLTYWILGPLINKGIVRLGTKALLILLVLAFNIESFKENLEIGAPWIRDYSYASQLFLALFIGDFFLYWMHRLFHTTRLWPFHAVHHSSIHLNWMSAARVHPVNELFSRTVQVFFLGLIGIPASVLIAYVPIINLYGIFVHANVNWGFGPFKYLFLTPLFHRWHHTSQAEGLDKNFAGFFPFWDWVFGTLYLPKAQVPERFGLDNEVMPESYLKQLAYPFRKVIR